MRTVAIACLAGLLPLQAWAAEAVELTLNCEYETVLDIDKLEKNRFLASFSATVQMSTIVPSLDKRESPTLKKVANIKVTTGFCSDYIGSFSELQIYGMCRRPPNYEEILLIDRNSGEFTQNVSDGKSARPVLYQGHCKPGKKLF